MDKAYINLEVKDIDIYCELPIRVTSNSNFNNEYDLLGKGYIIYEMENNKPTKMSMSDYYCYVKK